MENNSLNIPQTMTVTSDALHELVRGEERPLVERLEPLVRLQDVSLDLASVDRIDAAGITALISLYGAASDSGHNFRVVNASERVRKILGIVGLDSILVYRNTVLEITKNNYESTTAA